MVLDPAVSLALRASFALLFAAAATHKLVNATQFETTLARYLRGFGINGHGIEKPLDFSLIVLEFMVAVTCVLPATQAAAGMLAGGALLLYAFAMTVNLVRGNVLLDCGCAWGNTRQSVRWALIIRNVLLAAAAFTLALPVASRDLAAVDVVSIILATVTAILLYGAANRLLIFDDSQAEQPL